MTAVAAERKVTLRGAVLTMSERGEAEAGQLLIEDGRIAAVGAAAAERSGSSTVWDFGDRVILPGFIDVHSHIEVGAVAAMGVDCRVPSVHSISEIQAALSERLGDADSRGGWVVGQGNLFLDEKLVDGRLPSRRDLDAVSRDVPIVIFAGGHVSCVNSRAIEVARLDPDNPPESTMGTPLIEVDEAGEPTGRIGELDAALGVPSPTEVQLRQALEDSLRDMFLRHGVTHVCEITQSRRGVELLDELAVAGKPMPRLSLALWVPGTYGFDEALAWAETLGLQAEPERVRVQGVKLFLDGGFSARTAAMTTTYLADDGSDTGDKADLSMSRGELREKLRRIAEADLDVIVHTCGEYATQALAEEAREAVPEGVVRAEHAGHLFVERERTFELMKSGRVMPMTNPAFIYNIGSALPRYIGPPAIGNRFVFRSMLEAGFRITGSSDIHVGAHPSQTSPFFMMERSCARLGFDGSPVDPEEAIDVVSALRMHTLYAAEALGVADRRGTLEAGKDADVIVVDRDPRKVPAEELSTVNVDYVFVDGRVVYSRSGAEPPLQTVPAA